VGRCSSFMGPAITGGRVFQFYRSAITGGRVFQFYRSGYYWWEGVPVL